MTDKERVDRFLDEISTHYKDTFEKSYDVSIAQLLFPELDWIDFLRRAAERQEKRDPEANSMRCLVIHLAPKLLGLCKKGK